MRHLRERMSLTSGRSPFQLLLVLAAVIALMPLGGCAGGQKTTARQPEGTYSFWPPLPDEPRIQFLTSYRFSSDVEPPSSAFSDLVFGTERQILPIGKPYGVAMWNGRIYVCDITNPAVVILDLKQQRTEVMSTRGERMSQPTDIAIAPDGMKYVVDRAISRIFVFNADDKHIATFGQREFVPVAAAVHGDELVVPDFKTQTILVMNRFTGELIRSFGEAGGDEGQFIRPLGIDVDQEGNIYVSDVIRGRIQKFAPDGTLIYTLGELADSAGNFVRPKHLAIDSGGVVYVVDAAFQNVQMFNTDGELLMYFGSAGDHPGSMSLPAGLAVTDQDLALFEPLVHPAFEAEGLILVTNQFGLNKVSVYAIGQLKTGKTLADIAPYAAEINTGLRQEATTPEDDAGEIDLRRPALSENDEELIGGEDR